jgi:hypothetical protein
MSVSSGIVSSGGLFLHVASSFVLLMLRSVQSRGLASGLSTQPWVESHHGKSPHVL